MTMRTSTQSSLHVAAVAACCALLWGACTNPKPGIAGSESTSDSGTGGHLPTTTATGTGMGGAGGTSSTGSTTGHGGSGGAPMGSIIEARFALPATGAPAFLDVPFPSDLYRDAGGHIPDIPKLSSYVLSDPALLVAGFGALDGFGTTAGAIFEIDDNTIPAMPKAAAIDVASLPATEADSVSATASVVLVDLQGKAGSALIPARADYHDDAPNGATTKPLLVVYPARGVVLAEGHRYAAVLTTGVKTKGGMPVGPSAGFRALRDGPRTTAAEMLYGTAVDDVSTLVPDLADKTKIAALAVYTTHSLSHEMTDLRGASAKAAAPVLQWSAASLMPMGAGLFAAAPLPMGYTATLDAWLGAPGKLADTTDDPADDQLTGAAHDAIAAVGTAVFDAPNYLLEAAMGYSDPTHHTFARDATSKPIANPAKPTSKIWMTIVLPKGAVPAGGFPTVILQHGLSGDRSYMLALADTFAKQGWASVGIETVTFGARASEAMNITDTQAAWAWSASPGSYSGPDGFVDLPNGSTDFFGGLQNLGAVRDQLRQSVLDLGVEIDVVRNPALDLGPLKLAVPGAKLDATRLVFLGNSLGALMGAELAAIDPYVKTFVLNVAGGGLMTELGAMSPLVATSLAQAAAINFGFGNGRFAPGHPLIQLLQHIVDPGDPLLFAGHIVTSPMTVNGAVNPPKNVLQIEALWDEYVSNEANEALARAAGFPVAQPGVPPMTGAPLGTAMPVNGKILDVPMAGITAVVVQTSTATHSANLHSQKGKHNYVHPWAQFDKLQPFKALNPFAVAEPYLPLQQMVTSFFGDAFAGAGAPAVAGFPAPVLDFDGDGFVDAMDADPNDPAIH
jgi:hypothetical protein